MTLILSVCAVMTTAVIGNRVLAVVTGLWLKVPPYLLLSVLVLIDAVQIPLYYWVYGKGAKVITRLPQRFQNAVQRDWTATAFGRWVLSVRGVGVLVIAALPTFGGGMWSATFLSYSSGLSRRAGAFWMMAGSALSYAAIWWMGAGLMHSVEKGTL